MVQFSGSTIPVTAEEWQKAVGMAYTCLMLDTAKRHGLLRGGPIVNAARCHKILELGSAKGFHPSPNAGEDLLGRPGDGSFKPWGDEDKSRR